jgi:hypothetical protein
MSGSGNVVAFPTPPVRKLSEEELDSIGRIRLGYAYNFAPVMPVLFSGSAGAERWSLAKFMDEAQFPFATFDIIDRLGIGSFDIGNFYANINLERIHLPAELSALTTAKAIAYLLDIVACELSASFERGQLRSVSALGGDALIRSIRAQGLEWRRGGTKDEINLYYHFVCAERHPVIGRAVHNAAINRWGAARTVA